MQATDLRVGNYVWNENRRWVIVENIVGRKINVGILKDGLSYEFSMDNLLAILLSPVLLSNSGFKKWTDEHDNRMIGFNDFVMEFMEFSTSEDDGFYFNYGAPVETHIKYLHQLQNIYYNLKGVELKINLSGLIKSTDLEVDTKPKQSESPFDAMIKNTEPLFESIFGKPKK